MNNIRLVPLECEVISIILCTEVTIVVVQRLDKQVVTLWFLTTKEPSVYSLILAVFSTKQETHTVVFECRHILLELLDITASHSFDVIDSTLTISPNISPSSHEINKQFLTYIGTANTLVLEPLILS